MGNLSKKERDRFYPLLVHRDGEICQLCRKTIEESGMLVIHEIKYERPLSNDNMKLLCLSCNRKLTSKALNIQRDGSPEYKKNIEKEPLFRKFVTEKLLENNFHYSYDELIDSGAYRCDISTETAKRYMRPLMSEDGPLSKPMGAQNGELHVWIKGHEPYYD